MIAGFFRFSIIALLILGTTLFTRTVLARDSLGEVSLQLRWYHQFQFAGYYAALEKGFYEDVGLRVNLVEGGRNKRTVEEVLSGDSEYGVSNSEILYHRLQGKPLVALAAIFQHSALVLVSKKEFKIHSPQDLAGKQVAMFPGPKTVELQAMFLDEGVSLRNLNILKRSGIIEDLANPRLQALAAYITDQPYLLDQRGIEYTILKPITFGIDFYGDCLFTTERELKMHPQRVKAFREASLKGWEYAMKNKDEMIGIISTRYHSSKSPEHLRYEAEAMQPLILPDLVNIGHMNQGRWRHIAETFRRLGMIDDEFSLDGFIYSTDKKPNVIGLYWTIGIIALIGGLISLLTILLLKFNHRLHREISERKLAEAEIARERDFVAAILQWIESIVVVIDLDGYVVSFNTAAEKCSGYRLDEVQKEPFWDVLVPEDEREVVQKSILNAKAGAIPNENKNYWVAKNGQKRLIHWFNSVLRDRGGNIEFVLCTGLDLTERSQIEEALESREEHYQAIFENIEEGYFECDLKGNLINVNSALIEILGFSMDELIGLNYRDYMDRETADKVFEMYNAIYKSGKSEKYLSYEIIQKKGDRRVMEASISLSHDSSGKPVGFHGIVRDVTERKRLEEMMVQSEKMISLGGLAAGMAHEINNPLGVMTALAQTIERRFLTSLRKNREAAEKTGVNLQNLAAYVQEQGVMESLAGIRDAGKRAAGIVRNMLDFSRKSESTQEKCDVRSILDKALELASSDYDLKKSFDFRAIRIEKQYQQDLPAIYAVRTEIEQVVLNLLKNSAQAMIKRIYDQDSPLIVLRISRDSDWIRIEVEDNGPGMDEKTRKRVFEPFFTTKEVGKGTGLGLSVSYFIITENHHGEFSVESRLNAGTKFIIRLPLNQPLNPKA